MLGRGPKPAQTRFNPTKGHATTFTRRSAAFSAHNRGVRETTASSDGVRLAYEVTGDGPRTVLLVHGWMTTGDVWDDLIPNLNKAGMRLVKVDLRGTGQSGAATGGFAFEQLSADLLAVADAVGAERFVAVGHSMGGQIVQHLGAHHSNRVEGLVLGCPVPAGGLSLPEEVHTLFRSSGENREVQGNILGMASPNLAAETRDRLLDVAATISSSVVEQTFDLWTGGGFEETLSKIAAPTLVLGSSDAFTPPELLTPKVLDLISTSRAATLPGPGHYVFNEAPQASAAVIDAFLAGLGGSN